MQSLGVMAALSLATSAGGSVQPGYSGWAAVMLLVSMTVARRRQSKATSGLRNHPVRGSFVSRVPGGIGVLCLGNSVFGLVLAGSGYAALVVSRRTGLLAYNLIQQESAHLFTGISRPDPCHNLPIVWKRYTGNFLNQPRRLLRPGEAGHTAGFDVLDILDFVRGRTRHFAPTRTHR